MLEVARRRVEPAFLLGAASATDGRWAGVVAELKDALNDVGGTESGMSTCNNTAAAPYVAVAGDGEDETAYERCVWRWAVHLVLKRAVSIKSVVQLQQHAAEDARAGQAVAAGVSAAASCDVRGNSGGSSNLGSDAGSAGNDAGAATVPQLSQSLSVPPEDAVRCSNGRLYLAAWAYTELVSLLGLEQDAIQALQHPHWLPSTAYGDATRATPAAVAAAASGGFVRLLLSAPQYLFPASAARTATTTATTTTSGGGGGEEGGGAKSSGQLTNISCELFLGLLPSTTNLVIIAQLQEWFSQCSAVVQGTDRVSQCSAVVQGTAQVSQCSAVVQGTDRVSQCSAVVQGTDQVSQCSAVVQGTDRVSQCSAVVQGTDRVSQCSAVVQGADRGIKDGDKAKSFLNSDVEMQRLLLSTAASFAAGVVTLPVSPLVTLKLAGIASRSTAATTATGSAGTGAGAGINVELQSKPQSNTGVSPLRAPSTQTSSSLDTALALHEARVAIATTGARLLSKRWPKAALFNPTPQGRNAGEAGVGGAKNLSVSGTAIATLGIAPAELNPCHTVPKPMLKDGRLFHCHCESKAITIALEAATAPRVSLSPAMGTIERLGALINVLYMLQGAATAGVVQPTLHSRLAAAIMRLYSRASSGVQQQCRDVVYSLPNARASNLKVTAFSPPNTRAAQNTDLQQAPSPSPLQPPPLVHQPKTSNCARATPAVASKDAQLVAVFNRLGGGSTASNVAGLARLALLAPHETMAMIVLEAVQAPNLHAPLHAALAQLNNFATYKASETEPTLLVRAIRQTLYPEEEEKGHAGGSSSGGGDRSIGGKECDNLAAFACHQLNPEFKDVSNKTDTDASSTGMLSDADVHRRQQTHQPAGTNTTGEEPATPIMGASWKANVATAESAAATASCKWLLEASPLTLLQCLCNLAAFNTRHSNQSKAKAEDAPDVLDGEVLALLHPELEWVATALAALHVTPPPQVVVSETERKLFRSWLGRLAQSLPWTSALRLHPLLAAAAAAVGAGSSTTPGLACRVPPALIALCQLDVAQDNHDGQDSSQDYSSGANVRCAVSLHHATVFTATERTAAAVVNGATPTDASFWRRQQYLAFFRAASISDALAVELAAKLLAASTLAWRDISTGTGTGTGTVPTIAANVGRATKCTAAVHATSFVGCLTVVLSSCTAEQADRLLQRVVSPCIDGMILEAPPCFWFPAPTAAALAQASATGGAPSASLEELRQRQMLWDVRQLPQTAGAQLKVWTRIILAINAADTIALAAVATAAAAAAAAATGGSTPAAARRQGGGEGRALGRAARAYSRVTTALFREIAGKANWGFGHLAGMVQILYYVCATAQLLAASAPKTAAGSTQAAPMQLVILAISLLDACLDKKKLVDGATMQAVFLGAVLQAVQLLPVGDERRAALARLGKFCGYA
eukprot:gene6061-8048_t